MQIFLPRDDCNAFIDGITFFAKETDRRADFYYDDTNTRGVFSWVKYRYFSGLDKELVDAYFVTRFPKLTVNHTKDGEEDIFFAYDEKITVNAGDYSAASSGNEQAWRNKVIEAVKQFDFPMPFVLEFYPRDNDFARFTPTVMLNPYGQWYNNGKPNVSSGPQIVAFNKVAILTHNQSQYNPANLYTVQDHPDEYVVLPFAIVYKNKKGTGNTVQICSRAYSDVKDASISKSIFDLLEDTTIWKRIIFHLLWTPVEQLKKEAEEVVIPLSLQVKIFRFQGQTATRLEIEALENSKIDFQRNINSYIKTITDYKIKESLVDEQIVAKRKELVSKANNKTFERELKALKALPYIKNFEFKGGSIVFYTEPIQIDAGPFLGGYEIKYSLLNKTLKIKNTENPHDQLAHPHIYQDGDICFGNYTDVFFRFETGEFFIGMQLLHEFLSSYNPEDEWGRRLIYWDAKFVFEDMKMRGLLHRLEGKWDSYYYDLYNEHINNDNYCPNCEGSIDECDCDRCQYCNELTDSCECWICYYCGNLVEDGCNCSRCECCQELISDCSCARCDTCEELMGINYSTHCECERCPETNNVLDDDDERCIECENFDCEYNNNENHATTQDEELPLEEAV